MKDMGNILILGGVGVGAYLLYENWGTWFPTTPATVAPKTTSNPPVTTGAPTSPGVTAPATGDAIVTALFGQPTSADASNIAAFDQLINSGQVTANQLQTYYSQVASLFSSAGLPIVPSSVGYYLYQLASGQMTLAQVTAEFKTNAGISGLWGLGQCINQVPAWAING